MKGLKQSYSDNPRLTLKKADMRDTYSIQTIFDQIDGSLYEQIEDLNTRSPEPCTSFL
jgi:hypothetical protein